MTVKTSIASMNCSPIMVSDRLQAVRLGWHRQESPVRLVVRLCSGRRVRVSLALSLFRRTLAFLSCVGSDLQTFFQCTVQFS